MKALPRYRSVLVLAAVFLVALGAMPTETSAAQGGKPNLPQVATAVVPFNVEPGYSQVLVIDTSLSEALDPATVRRYLVTIGVAGSDLALTSIRVVAGLLSDPANPNTVFPALVLNTNLSGLPTEPSPGLTTGSLTIGPVIARTLSIRISRASHDEGASGPAYGVINAYVEAPGR